MVEVTRAPAVQIQATQADQGAKNQANVVWDASHKEYTIQSAVKGGYMHRNGKWYYKAKILKWQ